MMRLGRTAELLTAGAVALGGIGYVLVEPGNAASDWASSSHMIQDQFRNEGEVRPLPPSAARVALSALAMNEDPFGGAPVSALTSQGGVRLDLGNAGTLEVAILDDAGSDRAQRLFSPRGDSYSPVVIDRGEREATVAVNYERRFETAGRGEELDVSFTPRAGLSVGPDGSAAGAGAEVRIGQYLRGDPAAEPRWYVFAGADRRALMYDPSKGVDFSNAMQLAQRQVVGDAQAGVAVRIGEADLSLAYVRREYKHVAGVTSFDETEEFGAVTVNWTW
jgi:hypothetical protein